LKIAFFQSLPLIRRRGEGIGLPPSFLYFLCDSNCVGDKQRVVYSIRKVEPEFVNFEAIDSMESIPGLLKVKKYGLCLHCLISPPPPVPSSPSM
jgi:hypothetical protein